MNDINSETLTRLTYLAGLIKKDSQEDYLFPDSVRERCPEVILTKHPRTHKLCTNEMCDCPCPFCSKENNWICCKGRGWNPSTDLAIWLDVTIGFLKRFDRDAYITFDGEGCSLVVSNLALKDDRIYVLGSPFDALSLALEQCYKNQERKA